MSRTYRRPYYKKSKRDNLSCRSHGSCPWCQGNRTHKDRVKQQAAFEEIREYGDFTAEWENLYFNQHSDWEEFPAIDCEYNILISHEEKMSDKAYLIQWGLLGEWWHVDDGATEDEVLDAILEWTKVRASREQIKQRLFGGFACGNHTGRHVYHATGHYTYLGVNSDLLPGQRAEVWEHLKENFDQGFDRTALFAGDAPEE